MNDHTGCGLGGRQYGTSQEIETHQGQNNPSAARLGAVKEFGSPLARRGQFARVIRSCHRRIHRVVLFRTSTILEPIGRSALAVLSRTEEPRSLYHQRAFGRCETTGL